MSVTLSIIALIALLLPFTLEAYRSVSSGRPAYLSVGRALIISGFSHFALLLALGFFGLLSRSSTIVTSVIIAAVWLYVRRAVVPVSIAYCRSVDISPLLLRCVPVIGVVAISIFVLAQVHFSYTGLLIRSGVIELVYERETLTPYYSDEWIIADGVREVIDTRALPLAHPFTANLPYVNVLLPFMLLVSHFFLVFGLDPVFAFAYAPLLMGVMLVLGSYLLARRLGAGKLASAIAALTLLFVTNGSNVAGLWYLIPVHAGIIALIAVFLSKGEPRWIVWLGYLLAVLLYPPSLLLVIAIALVSAQTKKERIWILPVTAGIAIIGALMAVAFTDLTFAALKTWLGWTFGRSVGTEFTGETVSYLPHAVVPLIVLVGCVFAAPRMWRLSKGISMVLAICIVLWIIHQLFGAGFFIDIQRVVFIGAFFLCVIAAFGYEAIGEYLVPRLDIGNSREILRWAILIVAFAAVIAMGKEYTQRDQWKRFTLDAPKGSTDLILPAPPASQYLHEDDIRIFSRYDVAVAKKRFLSTPWKGLVIAVAIGHVPIHTKSSITGANLADYHQFMNSSCEEKEQVARQFHIDLIYSTPFDCLGFIGVATSSESLVLYEFDWKTSQQN
jgi:hypothetical protein